MQPALLEPIALGQRRELNILEGAPGTTLMDELGLVEVVDRLGEALS